MCELLSREVLTAAEPADGVLEVQRLRFALPAGARTSGPVAHVKVRAPDVGNVRNRVRAYSMILNAEDGLGDDAEGIAAPSFSLTVKVRSHDEC